jgi:hypothetical protein
MAPTFPTTFLTALEESVTARNGTLEHGEIRFRCPGENHVDEHPSARWNGTKAVWCCDVCGEGGGALDLADRLSIPHPTPRDGEGMAIPNSTTATVQLAHGCTLEQYAETKLFPLDFLRQVGLSTVSYQGMPAVRMPYRTANGDEAAVRFRVALHGSERFRWRTGSKPQLYGQDRLPDARELGYVVVAEGESDCHTLWYHGEPAVGLPGAGLWKEDRDALLFDSFDRIYVVIEPDTGGEVVRKWLDPSSIRERVYLLDLGEHKDPSGLYLSDPDAFHDRWHSALDAAMPWTDLAATEQRTATAEAWQQCEAIAHTPNILDLVADTLAAAGVAGERRTIKLLYLILVSRFLERPVSAAIKGPSSGGKSYTLDRVLRLFPADAFHALSAMSERALAYGEEPLSHRFLVVYEAAGLTGEFASYLMRSLLSEGRVRYETVEKTKDGMKPRLIEREGPTGLLVTTTAVRLHPENETRLLSIPVTDTPHQTREILRALARDTKEELDPSPWIALQIWLTRAEHRVVIPYAMALSELVPPVAVRLRRDFGLLLSLIKSHAILHQASRERDETGHIVATLDDYGAVRVMIADLVAEGVEVTVPPSVRETVEAVRTLLKTPGSEAGNGSLFSAVRDNVERTVSLVAIAQALNLDKSAASRRVKEARERGYLRNLEGKRGQPAKITLGEPLPNDVMVLPELAALAARCSDAGVMAGNTAPSFLIEDTALQRTIANLLALAPDELEAYRAELGSAAADDPNLAHDREALRRAEAVMKKTYASGRSGRLALVPTRPP